MQILFIFFLFTFTSKSLEKQYTYDKQYCIYYTINMNLDDNSQLQAYYQTRRLIPDKSNHDQFNLAYIYKINQNVKVGTGFTYFLLHLPQSEGTPIEIIPQEFRPNQFISFSNMITDKLKFQNRILIEERFFQAIENNKLTDKYNFSIRLRLLGQFTYDLFKIYSENENFGVYISDEILVHFGSKIIFNTFDQNRFQTGIYYNPNKMFNLKLGYMHWFQETNKFTNETFHYLSRNAIVFSISNNFDLLDK